MPPDLIDQIRQALKGHVKETGKSYYAIARACGIDSGNLTRFRDGNRGLSMSGLNRLAKYLRLYVIRAVVLRSR